MRASNLTIGTTTLAAIAAAFVGLLSLHRVHNTHRSPLRIVFDGSASGLREGGAVDFDGVPAGEIKSIKLESPHKIVALVMLDNSAPIRKDTAVGIEFQGLTGLAAISLVGGAATAPPVSLDKDGIPVLSANWSEQQSITDTLHNVDKILIDNRAALSDALLSFETYTTSLKSKSEALEGVLGKAENALASFDKNVTRTDSLAPGLADGKAEELVQKAKSIRELADSFRRKSTAAMEDARHTLLDISEAANQMDRKPAPGAAASPPPPPRQQAQERQ